MFFADSGALAASGVLTYRSTFRAPSLPSLALGENHRPPTFRRDGLGEERVVLAASGVLTYRSTCRTPRPPEGMPNR